MKTLLFLLLSNLCIAQTLKIKMEVERVPSNSTNTPNTKSFQQVFLILETNRIGIITQDDTLALVSKTLTTRQQNSNSYVGTYIDELHDNQLYQGQIVRSRHQFIIFIAPLKPYNRKVYSLILTSL